jgi:hypothetical protein
VDQSVAPEQGFVPDQQTAMTIVTAVLIPIYGKSNIELQRPIKVTLADGVWTVRGQLPKTLLGGVFEIRLKKQNGEILYVAHGQ